MRNEAGNIVLIEEVPAAPPEERAASVGREVARRYIEGVDLEDDDDG